MPQPPETKPQKLQPKQGGKIAKKFLLYGKTGNLLINQSISDKCTTI